jgi:hypothetical protein
LGLQSFDVGPYAALPAPLLTPLRTARFELGRRRAALSQVRGEELDDIATQAADDALMAVLAKLDDYRGAGPFTTWAYKFALLEAGVRLRRRAWQDREVVLDRERWPTRADPASSASSRSRARTPTSDPRTAQPPRRLHRLPRGARQPARPRRGRAPAG